MQATWPAGLVHAYTATGAVLAFLAVQAATDTEFPGGVSVVVRCRAGGRHRRTICPRVRVHERLPNFSGQKVDDLVDYLTFVFVPAVIVWQAGV